MFPHESASLKRKGLNSLESFSPKIFGWNSENLNSAYYIFQGGRKGVNILPSKLWETMEKLSKFKTYQVRKTTLSSQFLSD